jgi:hypothetical protein
VSSLKEPVQIAEQPKGTAINSKRKRNSKRPKNMSNVDKFDLQGDTYELLQCLTYQNVYQQPYRIYFTFEVQMLMMVHAYLSKNEVIGILAGQIYETELPFSIRPDKVRILVVSKIYPTESCVHEPAERLRNCEISDTE